MHPSPPPPPPPPPPHPPPHCLTDEKPATTKPEFTAFCSCSSPQQTGLTSAHATSRLLFLIHDFNTTKLNWNVNTAKCRYATLVELRGLRVSFLLFHCSVWFYVYSCINDIIFFSRTHCGQPTSRCAVLRHSFILVYVRDSGRYVAAPLWRHTSHYSCTFWTHCFHCACLISQSILCFVHALKTWK